MTPELTLWSLLFFVVATVTHELGHAVLAVWEGIYEDIAFLPTPHVKMSGPYRSPWGYLSGLAGSVVSFPVFLMTAWYPSMAWIFPCWLVFLALVDIVVAVWHWRVPDQVLVEAHEQTREEAWEEFMDDMERLRQDLLEFMLPWRSG